MEILLWLAPTGIVAVVMMVWATWAGRPRREHSDRSEAAYERFAAAIRKEHPGAARPRPMVARDRSTGIAIRPSRSGRAAGERTGQSAGQTRRSA
ncbi:MAG TPA: hypothetical protein VK204_10410 [Nocardioidaceae bacterium]|nr:hypothetical protein [Nocardioidaceae bacterium]